MLRILNKQEFIIKGSDVEIIKNMKKVVKYIPIITDRFVRIFFLVRLTLVTRISIILNTFAALTINLFRKKKIIRYFGQSFIYEYWSDPLTFLAYPPEISSAILNQVDQDSINNVLDIGGNVGQFSVTFVNMGKPKQIDIFEPNGKIFEILENNTKPYKSIKLYNYGVGNLGERKFYFKAGKSATGSILKENAFTEIEELDEINIRLINDVSKITGRKTYDLVKVDVEGFESEVIKNLKGVKTKYLLIEVSSNREKNYSTSELYTQIMKTFGNFEIIYQDPTDRETNSYNVLLEFK